MSQKADILNHLKAHKTITPMDALRVCEKPCMRLAPRIEELVADGYNIVNENPPGQFARYRLIEPGQGVLFNV